MILQFCEPRNFSLCPRSLVGVYSGGLGVWFMTFCCCLVEFGSSCFNHASIESCFVWFGPWYATLHYSPFYFYNVPFPGETEYSVRKNVEWDSSVFIRSCEKWMFCTRLNLARMLVWTCINFRTWILVYSHLWRTSLLYGCVETEGQDQPIFLQIYYLLLF